MKPCRLAIARSSIAGRAPALAAASALLVTLAPEAGAWSKGKSGTLPAGFVDLAEVAPDVVVDVRYAGANNFLGRPARGYGAARCVLTTEAARALADVEREVAASGLGLMVYDCYRPAASGRRLRGLGCATRPARRSTPAHHPRVRKSELLRRGYIAAHSGHSRGSTVDLTLVPAGRRGGRPRRRATADRSKDPRRRTAA